MRAVFLVFIASTTFMSGGLNAVDLRYPDDNPCIEVMMDAEFTITNGNEEKKFTLDGANVLHGDCINTPHNIAASVNPIEGFIYFSFTQTSAAYVFMVLVLVYDPSIFSDSSETGLHVVAEDGYTKLGSVNQAFACNDEVKRIFRSKQNDINATMTFSNAKIQAFSMNGSFSNNVIHCPQDIAFIPTAVTKNSFSVSEGNITCIVFQAEMKLTIPYKKTNGSDETKTIYVPPTSNITQSGSCNLADNITATTQELKLTFYNGWALTLTFAEEVAAVHLTATGDFSYYLDEIELTYILYNNLFPDVESPGQTFTVKQNFTDQLVGSNQGSYMCNADTTLNMGDGVTLSITSLQYQAFKDTPGNVFGTATDCKVDEETHSPVLIAVVAALVGLVVIVPIAYLKGRRQSRTGHEYQRNEEIQSPTQPLCG